MTTAPQFVGDMARQAGAGGLAMPDAAYQAGYLRRTGAVCQIGAANDLEAVQTWLREYESAGYSEHTLSAARRESERFVMWVAHWLRKPISDVRREDVQAYRAFLQAPDPSWCGDKHGKADDRWRPFVGPLSDSSARQALAILGGMYGYLVDVGYLEANPIARIGRGPRRSSDEHDQERVVTPAMWQLIMAHIEDSPRETVAQQIVYERSRFVFSFTYLLAPRVRDFPNHAMSDIRWRSHGANRGGGWWWHAIGKGNKAVPLPMNDEAVSVLMRWRNAMGLAQLPLPGDKTPLVPSIQAIRSGRLDHAISAGMIWREVKTVVRAAAMRSQDAHIAEVLPQVSPHWLRHTALSAMAEYMPASTIQRLGRHSDIKTTGAYIHVGDQALYEAAQRHSLTAINNKLTS